MSTPWTDSTAVNKKYMDSTDTLHTYVSISIVQDFFQKAEKTKIPTMQRSYMQMTHKFRGQPSSVLTSIQNKSIIKITCVCES